MFSIIIPCFKDHIYSVFNIICCFLLENKIYENDTNIKLINNITIICNGLEDNHITEIIKQQTFFDNYYSEGFIKYEIYKENVPPGKAREMGIKSISLNKENKYCIFHDADDIPHPQKIRILKYFFMRYNCDHILHLFQPLGFNFINYDDFSHIMYTKTKKIIQYIKKKKKVNFDIGNIIKARVSQGLISVRLNAIKDIKWTSKMSGEDKAFNKISLHMGNKLIMLDCYLSEYDRYNVKMMKKIHKKRYKELRNMKSKRLLICYNDKLCSKKLNDKIFEKVYSKLWHINDEFQEFPYEVMLKKYRNMSNHKRILKINKNYNKILCFIDGEDILNLNNIIHLLNYNLSISSFEFDDNFLTFKPLSKYGKFYMINNINGIC